MEETLTEQISKYFDQSDERPSKKDAEIMEMYADRLSEHEIVPSECIGPLINTAMNRHVEGLDFWNVGKHLQMAAPFGAIPFKCEYEVVAGYWAWLRHHSTAKAKAA